MKMKLKNLHHYLLNGCKNNFVSDTQFMLLYNPDIEELNPNKYSDYYSKNNIKIRLTCSVESDGRITISNDKLYG